MKTRIVILSMLALFLASGCSDPKPEPEATRHGGIAANDQQFTIAVPWTLTIKQGEVRSAMISLNRESLFKQDVNLNLQVEGITVTPERVLVKAGEKPEVNIQIEAGKDAALGDYRVFVKGTPQNGAVAQAHFNVVVTAP